MLFSRQTPAPSHESAASHCGCSGVRFPHGVNSGSKTSGHALLAPSQLSRTSHSPASARHWDPAASTRSTQPPAALHESAASQSVSVELPQPVNSGSKTFSGQAPEVPVQSSSTSHWPASARQVTVAALNSSTQVLAVPLQWSVSSHRSPFEVPVHVVVSGSKAFSGQAPEVPVQSSSTSHWPASARQVTVAGSGLGWHAPVPLQVSGLSQTVSEELPQAVPGASLLATQRPLKQLSGLSQTVSEPSPHGRPFAARALLTQTFSVSSQLSTVQALESLQVWAVPSQKPVGLHASPVVQNWPSSHVPVAGGNRHAPIVVSHWSNVHELPSKH